MEQTDFFEKMERDCIKLAALSRRFQLGNFYDYRTDQILKGTMETLFHLRKTVL